MAGAYFQFITPGYSELWTLDVPYVPGSGEASDLNPFAPRTSDRPLLEGEWLQFAAPPSGGSGKYVTRGGNNAISTPGTPDGEGTKPAFPYWMEQGRGDVQTRRKAHIVFGPSGYVFRTQVCDTTGLVVGDAVSVWDIDSLGGSIVRRGLAKRSSGYGVGYVVAIHGTNDISVLYTPNAS